MFSHKTKLKLMIILKIDVNLKSFLAIQFQLFQLLFESTFSLKFSLLLNSSIRWRWLLFHLIKVRRKYKQVTKFGQHLIITSWTYTRWCFCRLNLKLLFEMVTSHSYNYNTLLQFCTRFTRVSTTMSAAMIQ